MMGYRCFRPMSQPCLDPMSQRFFRLVVVLVTLAFVGCASAPGGFIRPGAVERFDRMVNTLAERIVAGI
jgi:hypothetical protein